MSHVAGMLSYQEAKCLPTKAVNASVSEYQTFHLDMHTQYSNQYISISRNKFIYGVRMCLDGKGREDKSFLWRHRDCDVLYASEATICIISLSSLVCMVGVIFVYIDTVYWFYGYSFFMLNWIFQHDYLDTYCFECLICMRFVFAPVQRNWACFTWKGALEMCLLLLLLPFFHCCLQIKTIWSNQCTRIQSGPAPNRLHHDRNTYLHSSETGLCSALHSSVCHLACSAFLGSFHYHDGEDRKQEVS